MCSVLEFLSVGNLPKLNLEQLLKYIARFEGGVGFVFGWNLCGAELMISTSLVSTSGFVTVF